MSAVLARRLLIERPAFDNTHLGSSPQRWTSDNTSLLARYFHDLTETLPEEELTETSDADLRRWIMCQYEIEVVLRQRERLPHGGSL